jgi:MFS family permease
MTAGSGIRRRLSGGLGPNYWRVWTSSAGSNLADGIFWIAFPLLAIRLTDSPVLVAGVTIAGRLPWLFFVLFAGALADRLDRRRTMLTVAVFRTVVSAIVAVGVFANVVSLPMLYVIALVLGVGETLFDTAAQSLMPNVVRSEQLSDANGRLYAVELTMNQFVGPPVGGLLSGLAIAGAFAGSALSYLVGVVSLSSVRGSFKPESTGPRGSILSDIRVGLDFLFHHRLLRTFALMVGVMNLSSSAVFAVFVLYAVSPGPMGLNEFGYGVLSTALAVGSLVGSLLTARAEARIGKARLLLLCVISSAVTTLIIAFTANPWIIGAGFALNGLTIVMWNVVTVSLRQRITPNELLGRLNASYRLLAWGTQPIGALLGGLLGQAFGLPAVFLVSGAVVLVLLPLFVTIVTEREIAAAETGAPGEQVPAAA